jgi:hypothetical protein
MKIHARKVAAIPVLTCTMRGAIPMLDGVPAASCIKERECGGLN